MVNKPSPSSQRPDPTPDVIADADTEATAGAAGVAADADADTDAEAVTGTANFTDTNAEAADTDTTDVGAEVQYPALTVDIDSEDFLPALREAREEANRKSDQPIPAYREYPPGEVSARGKAIYRDRILPRIEPPPKGVFVAIDIDSGDYEIHERDITAGLRLMKRRPTAMTFLMRVGYPAAYRHTGIRPSNSRPSPAPRA